MKAFEELLAFLNSFSFQLIVAELFVCASLPKRKSFAGGVLLLTAIAVLFSRAMSPYMPWKEYGTFSRWPYFWIGEYFNGGLLVVFSLTVAAMLLCFRVKVPILLLACISSYIMQNLSYQFVESFRYVAFGEEMTIRYRLTSIAVSVVLCFGLSFLLRRIFRKDGYVLPSTAFVAIFSAIAILVIVGFSTFITLLDHTNSLLHVYAVLCCALLICEIMNVFSKEQVNVEKQKIEEIYRKAAWQYDCSQNNIDLLNRKCHDLRHELEALRAGVSASERESYLTELERIIRTYDMRVRTGNRTLDTILNEKYEACAVKHIAFSYAADGACLDFFQTIDLYTMLGNALDNAIEAEEKEEEGKRYVYIHIQRAQNMVSVTIENFCSRSLTLENGMPVTDKPDRHNHGYGLKSIKRISEKYDGHCKWILEDSCFRLALLFPRD